ncbi:MAG: hypothetical protein R3B48_12220 [Kofleriaceae bacterium]
MKSPCARIAVTLAVVVLISGLGARLAAASDHDDTPLLKDVGRHDARITDFYAFIRDGRLVLVVATNPAIPPGVSQYQFPDDLTVSVYLDRLSPVSFADPVARAKYGGTVLFPWWILEDLVFEVSFSNGRPQLRTQGLSFLGRLTTRVFAGLRDDPFIRGPRTGRNVAAVVIDVPLYTMSWGAPMLVWAGTSVPEADGEVADLGGRALRSQFAENLALNDLHPSLHQSELGVPPDVIILDPLRPIAFPNGRELTDDVVDLVGDPRVLANDAPFPTQNDVPWLTGFPFLAPPQLP